MTSPLVVNKTDTLRNLLSESDSVGIVIGENQNIDIMAGALGLYLAILESGKTVQIVSKKDPIVELSNLVGVNKIKKNFEGKTKILTISVPYREGEIEKVSYNIEEDKLKVNLFAEENGISFSENEIEYLRKGSSPSLIFTIGVQNNEELKGFADSGVKTVVIDTNPLSSVEGEVSLVDPSFSSVSEIVCQVIMDLGLRSDIDVSQNLLDGITYATRNFSLPTTSAYAFEAAGFLMQNGARRKSREERKPSFSQNDSVREEQILNKLRQEQRKSPPPSFSLNNERLKDFDASSLVSANEDAPSIEEVEREVSSDVPSDWFMPKVFKGSKKGNQE